MKANGIVSLSSFPKGSSCGRHGMHGRNDRAQVSSWQAAIYFSQTLLEVNTTTFTFLTSLFKYALAHNPRLRYYHSATGLRRPPWQTMPDHGSRCHLSTPGTATRMLWMHEQELR